MKARVLPWRLPVHRRTYIRATIAALALALTCTACGTSSAGPTATNECAKLRTTWAPVTDKGTTRATGSQITIDAANAGFAPTCVTDVPEGTVTLVVHNTGKSIHNVQISAQHVDVDIAPGQTVNVGVTVGRDPVVYVCKYHRTIGMVGFLVPPGN